MKEHPILFSAPMVLAILDGRKTVTRRAMNPQPSFEADGCCWYPKQPKDMYSKTERGLIFGSERSFRKDVWKRFAPYGVPGDRLWVREVHFRFGHWEPIPGRQTKGGKQKWQFVADSERTLFDGFWLHGGTRFDGYYQPPARTFRDPQEPTTPQWHKRLARFMFRRDSRILLEVVSVQVERLQEITEEEALREGFLPDEREYQGAPIPFMHSARDRFRALWDELNAGRGVGWDANPWVWRIEFRRATEVAP